MSEEERTNAQKPLYKVKAYKKTVRFIWCSNPDKPLIGSTDLKTRLSFSELFELAERIGCQVKDSEILPPNLDAYNRLLVYACVRTYLRKPPSILRLADCVVGMSGLDVLYWASAFKELWWSNATHRSLRKVVKAFKLFFDVE